MIDEEVVDTIISVDVLLNDVEKELGEGHYGTALKKLREARDTINELREDDESLDDRQSIELEMIDRLK